MTLLIFFSILPFRKRWYETFLRFHQVLATAAIVLIIKHLILTAEYNWIPIYIFVGIFCSLESFYVASIIYRNFRLGSRCSYLEMTYTDGIINATLHLSRPLAIDAGQYINIWVPSVSLFSSHPFTVISWDPSPQGCIKLLIKPRDGFTHKLSRDIENRNCGLTNSRVFFSGPLGSSAAVWDYNFVLLFATGFGIVTMLPYLIKLIYGCKESKSRSKRIHLIWHVLDSSKFPNTAHWLISNHA